MNAPKPRRAAYRLRPAAAARASIGLLALASDATIETEWRTLLALDGVEFNTARVPCDATVTPQTLRATETRLADAARRLLPESPLDVLAYACTSATLVIGFDAVAAALRAVRPESLVSTPLSAAEAALQTLGARRIALLTPYVEPLHRRLIDHLSARGLDVVAAASFALGRDPDVVRIDPASIAAAVRALCAGAEADAAFVACTALRAAALVPRLERELGVAVTTSNHALAWHALRLAGVTESVDGRGRLFAR